MRLTHALILSAVGLVVGAFVLACTGIISIGPLNQKNLHGMWDEAFQSASGYTPATTPAEAMERFRDAIQKRRYNSAARYCTGQYAEILKKGHKAAMELGNEIDPIREYAKTKGLLTDKVAFTLFRLDPFPKNFVIRNPPDLKDENKAKGVFIWEEIRYVNFAKVAADSEIRQLDPQVFNNVLAGNAFGEYGNPVMFDMVKEKDGWKLNITTSPDWMPALEIFLERYKAYHTGLGVLHQGMTNDRHDTASFEAEVMTKIRNSKAR